MNKLLFFVFFSSAAFCADQFFYKNGWYEHVAPMCSIEDYYNRIESYCLSYNIAPSKVFVAIDIDEVLINKINHPVEGDVTKQVLKNFIERGYNVYFVTSRFHGLSRDYLKGKNFDVLGNKNSIVNILDLPSWLKDNNSYEEFIVIDRSLYGYLFGTIFYASTHKADMLAAFFERRESDGQEKYKALFVLDDKLYYLTQFVNNKYLQEYFNGQVNPVWYKSDYYVNEHILKIHNHELSI